MYRFKVANESELAEAVKTWAQNLKLGDWIALDGDMGVGKTTFVRHILRSLGYQEPVVSPSFPILIEYELGALELVHIDAFRLQPDSADAFDTRDWKEKIVFVEWPQNTSIHPKDFRYRVSLNWGDAPLERWVEIQEVDRDLSETRG